MQNGKSAPKSGSERPLVAIPEPCGYDREYTTRVLPDYVRCVEEAGGQAVIVPLSDTPEQIARKITACSAVLLPGSKADVDPQKYSAVPDPNNSPADPLRDAADELLLQDAYNLKKPVFGICYGLQALNVWRTGTLVQHIESEINHEIGRKAEFAHDVEVASDSLLAKTVGTGAGGPIRVNSSHHQSAAVPGDGLRVSARCPEDGVIEALEGTMPGHFVLAVQWHPERTVDKDGPSRAIFSSFIEAARHWKA